MKRGISERFDDGEQEQDTTPRVYPDMVEQTKRTAKMSAFHVESILRTESGLRAVIGPEQIEEHLRSRLAESAAEQAGPEEAHDRPTIDVGRFPEQLAVTPDLQGSALSPAMLHETTLPTRPLEITPMPVVLSPPAPGAIATAAPVARRRSPWTIPLLVLLGLVGLATMAAGVLVLLGKLPLHR